MQPQPTQPTQPKVEEEIAEVITEKRTPLSSKLKALKPTGYYAGVGVGTSFGRSTFVSFAKGGTKVGLHKYLCGGRDG